VDFTPYPSFITPYNITLYAIHIKYHKTHHSEVKRGVIKGSKKGSKKGSRVNLKI
jgi:hypothetical protein